jgi:thiosulfate dehydrogenase (quinone) large subunit
MSYVDSLNTRDATAHADVKHLTLSVRAGTGLRLALGVIWAINAFLKWLPGYRNSYLDGLKGVAQGQPGFLHGWFHFWITLQSGSPSLWADLTGVAETSIAIVLLLGIARRPGYLFGAVYMLLVWGVGEGFGGPYTAGATDVGTGIIYTVLFLVLFVTAPTADQEPFSLDRLLVARYPKWARIADLGRSGSHSATSRSASV